MSLPVTPACADSVSARHPLGVVIENTLGDTGRHGGLPFSLSQIGVFPETPLRDPAKPGTQPLACFPGLPGSGLGDLKAQSSRPMKASPSPQILLPFSLQIHLLKKKAFVQGCGVGVHRGHRDPLQRLLGEPAPQGLLSLGSSSEMLSQWAGLPDPSDQTDIGYSGRGGLISISLAPGLRPRGLPPEGPDPSWSRRGGSGLLGGGYK